jgi:N-carbamoyl-L-amino-acid hydrolase
MLFVRNPTGVSHAPAEHAAPADCLAGVAALADVLVELTGEPADRRTAGGEPR